jgi:hypothetical protein
MLAPARPESAAGRTTFVALAAREMHRFVVNPVFLFAVVMTAWTTWDDRKAPVTGVGTGNWYPWIVLVLAAILLVLAAGGGFTHAVTA